MRLCPVASLLCLMAISVCSTASAEDGWKLSSLIPFKKSSETTRARASISDTPAKRGFPKLSMPGWPSRSKSPKSPHQPSTLDKLNKSTKDFFGKTKDVLMPWSKSSKKPATRHGTRTPAKKKSFFGSLFSQKEDPKKLTSVKDFLALKRVPY